MTTFRFSAAAIGCAVAITGLSMSVRAEQRDACESVDPQVGRECIGRRIAAKEQRLEALFEQALHAVGRDFARYGRVDRRGNPSYLMTSQRTWKQFVDSDCTVRAAFGGGSNLSITDRVSDCYENALDQRIEFLGELADGSFGAQ